MATSEIRNEGPMRFCNQIQFMVIKISLRFCLDVSVTICSECVVTRPQESEISLYYRDGLGQFIVLVSK